MDFLKKIKWTPINILKAVGVGVLALLLLMFVGRLLMPTFGGVFNDARYNMMGFNSVAPSYGGVADEMMRSSEYGMAVSQDGDVKLSLTNIGVPYPYPIPGVVGNDAEDFEVTEYNVYIETRNKEKTCEGIVNLKLSEYVIFENANEYDEGCGYTFKVAHKNVESVLLLIEELNPKNVSENVYTIKRQLDDFTSEMDILESKLKSIDDTLSSAMRAYDEITALASRTQNADALAKIIDSKIGIIERLTNEKINITANLERLNRSKAEQLDKLDYTYFYVTVQENKFVDGEAIKDSWKYAVKSFVNDINGFVQDITLNLVLFLFTLAQYILYIFILLLVVKYLWVGAKYLWKK
ncbi:hypothetical protein COW81_01120 [Candidatus Campbellbacteria bacterium CG22_combo_CG10-13_8_21_14_all_36_13]|uniref:Uncharacterized protein n=1 Tax=Candidatus Campbellbacteria bacterium CG22_combo_CG10-13_8_21_14_all_36_13 TaxID=1974529 RepID=A0A2H0DYP6_9BACT|nr:MAG: hypothetical protein COW81_01120 [Candidatus Campbellbacteria bacterium CG22_combo_CG10-13_8_21_14_all_36_13]